MPSLKRVNNEVDRICRPENAGTAFARIPVSIPTHASIQDAFSIAGLYHNAALLAQDRKMPRCTMANARACVSLMEAIESAAQHSDLPSDLSSELLISLKEEMQALAGTQAGH